MTEPTTPSEYIISELEEASGVSRRTIHYYIARGLLPPPDGAGLAARYGETHLLRLRLIEVLKRASLRLEGVREMLDAMSPEDLRRLTGYAEEHPSLGGEALRAWAVRAATRSPEASGFVAPGFTPVAGRLDALASPVDDALKDSNLRDRYHTRRMERTSGLDRYPEEASTWQRMRVLPDLEIHFRPRSDSRFTARLYTVVEFIRRTFGEEREEGGGRGGLM
jgi:DNA-binding transcriptional MerR regulator